jgi:hypothetical protein
MTDQDPQAPPSIDDLDEGPDYVRLGILLTVLLGIISVAIYTWFINPPKKKYYADMPGINLASVSQPQRAQIMQAANAMACDCAYDGGCKLNVAECRNIDKECDVSLKRAGQLVQRVTGKPAVFTQPAAPSPSAASPKASASKATPKAQPTR